MRLIATLGMLLVHAGMAQQLTFAPVVGDTALVLGRSYTLPDGTPVTIDRFRFYMRSDMDTTYHLIDAEDSTSFQITGFVAQASGTISFLLGVDSVTNVGGAFSGALDPVQGMYWTWHSGYINVKLEGTSPASPYPDHAFQLHLGGYLTPHATERRIVLPVEGKGAVVVNVDLLPLLLAADVRTRCNVMSPGPQAVRLSEVLAGSFKADELR